MNRTSPQLTLAVCLALSCSVETSWAAQPPNVVISDTSNNVAAGSDALLQLTTGISNTAVGTKALFSNTTGSNNTATGVKALNKNTTGLYNTATGFKALNKNTDGLASTATGAGALLNSTGQYNTATGAAALLSNTTGESNTAAGVQALFSNTTGSNNVALGFGAGVSLVNGSNNIYLGSDAGSTTESTTIRLGTAGTQTATFIAGISGITVTGVPVLVSSTGQLGVQTSSARFKQDIKPMAESSASLMQLKPVTFHYKQEPKGDLQYGLLAEDVARVYPELAVRDGSGHIEAIRYQELTPMLLNEMQKQAKALQSKEQEIGKLQRQVSELQGKVAQVNLLAARLEVIEQRAGTAGSLTVASANSLSGH